MLAKNIIDTKGKPVINFMCSLDSFTAFMVNSIAMILQRGKHLLDL